jgi:hypothetical protein
MAFDLWKSVIASSSAVVLAFVLNCFSGASADADGFTSSVSESSRFFRLVASYMHGEERVDFDIVSACGVRVTIYADNDTSHDVFRYPFVFVLGTRDGGAVMQMIPDACEGATTAGGQVPRDFMPGAIWFDDPPDFTLGIAYVTEEAFESPNSKLKFLGARIEVATRKDWEAFQASAPRSLIDPIKYNEITPAPTVAEVRADRWNRGKMAQWVRSSFQCYGYQRFHLTDLEQRKVLSGYWPATKPRYWSPGNPRLSELIAKLMLHVGMTAVNDRLLSDYFAAFTLGAGFPTRVGGGVIGKSKLPASLYPLSADDGVPWARPELADATTLYRDIIIGQSGFAYCYSVYGGFGQHPIMTEHLPDYGKRRFVTRVDGEAVDMRGVPRTTVADFPQYIFESDEWVFRLITFGV